jgi:AraC-like DNA-binding protein
MTEMAGGPPVTEVAGPLEALDWALERLRLEGAIFMRCEFSESWTFEGGGGPNFAAMMHPGAERLVLFHVIASGRCWVLLPGGERHWASAGEVIVLPYGDEFTMSGVEATTPVPIASIVPPPPWTPMPVVRYGGGGGRTDVVCGCLYSEDALFDPGRAAFPPVFVVRPADGPARSWFDASIAYALEESSGNAPSRRATKLPELLITEALRMHLATAPAAERGWIVGLRDPLLGPAMAAIHAAPERRWTVDDLAAHAGVSRSRLDARFREVLGRSPIRYLNEWRMHVAQDLLATTDITVAAIAHRVGYDAEEAFSRAFKRAHGRSPALWRTARPGRSAH